MNGLSNSNSTGLDGYHTKIVKSVISAIASPLADIFNISFKYGVFPDLLKNAKITPIFKADDKSMINNYRPISVLPVFSKILEKLMYQRLISFLDQHKVLNDNQYGFRENHSTDMALINMIDQISSEMDNKQYSIGIFLDLSKAFDTIDHSILLQKLETYGIRGIALSWFRSYLSNRSQCVTVNGKISDYLPITCGVPQGSILGPLLFILYINDLVNTSRLLKFIMFADDTNIFYSHKSLTELIHIVNIELNQVSNWLKANKLSLNVKKTHFILFHFRQRKIDQLPSVLIDNNIIEQVKSTKFLGVVINENLTWTDHINILINKCSKNVGILRKLRHSLPPHILVTLYNTLILPYLNYCNIAWASQPNGILDKLFVTQKKAIRILTNSTWNAHSLPLFKTLNLLTVQDINKLQISCFTYRALHHLLPHHFQHYFQLNSLLHSHNTRTSSQLHIHSYVTTHRSYTIRIHAPRTWNSLPTELHNLPTLPLFKRKIKLFLLSTYV